jgi:hypothetical protein
MGYLFHKLSTNEKPEYVLCQSGDDSRWKLKKNASSGVANQPEHSTCKLAGVMDAIKSLFGDLASVNLLKRCLYGKTPNPNKSLKSVIFTRVPKIVL